MVNNKTAKRKCIKNAKTRRCIKSEKINETSQECKFFNKTDRCRNNKDIDFISYHNVKMKKSVKSFIDKNILKKSAQKMRDIKNDNGLYIPLDDYSNDDDMKEYIIDEVLDLAKHYERDNNQSDVISLKTIKTVIKNDTDLKLILS